ncbi:MAG: QueT transporter family protein [Clostridia bacterium]|nr:QueT transporter family protein [Clostridia bacterium]
MNIPKKTYGIAVGSVIAALYVALTYAQEAIFPGSASMAVQFRLSEAMTMLCVFTPYAIPGLTVGCLLANIVSAGALPIDMLMGTFASFIAAVCIYKTKNICFKGLPILSALMPAIFNGIIIGVEIEMFFIEGSFNFISFLTQAGFVALGELTVCLTLGLLLVKVIKNKKLEKYLNSI